MTLKKRKQGVEISFARFMEVVVFVTVVCYAADSTGVPDVVCVNILIFTWTKLDESSKLPSGGGGGVLLYITYTGMCRPTGS